MCLLGCGVSTGWGAVWNTVNVENGASVAVFGCGAVGLSVIQAAKLAGARRVIAIDLNPNKFTAARAFGATDCVDASQVDGPIQQHIVGMTQWGCDYTFDWYDAAIKPSSNPWHLASLTRAARCPCLLITDATLRCHVCCICIDAGSTGNTEVMRAALECAHRGCASSEFQPATQGGAPPHCRASSLRTTTTR